MKNKNYQSKQVKQNNVLKKLQSFGKLENYLFTIMNF